MINIDNLTEPELIDLHNRIVARLQLIAQMHAHARMLDFSIGNRVSFQSPTRGPITGILIRYNKKSVTVISDTGERWNVSPDFLQRVAPPNQPDSNSGAIDPLRLRKG